MCLEDIDCVILCGGTGERLRDALEPNTPKVLAPVNGRTVLDYIIGTLHRHSAQKVYLAAGHLSHKLLEWIEEAHHFEFEIIVSVQLVPDGTVDAIRTVRHALKTEPVLICNGDTLTDVDLCEFVRQYDGGVAYLRAPSYYVHRSTGQSKPMDTGFRLFSQRRIDEMIRSGAYRVEDFVGSVGKSIDGRGTFLDIGTSKHHYKKADEYTRFMDA